MDEKRVPLFAKLRESRRDKLHATAKRLGLSLASVVEILIWDCCDSILPAGVDPATLPPDARGNRGQGRRKPAPLKPANVA